MTDRRGLSSLRGRLTIVYFILITTATAALGLQVYRWTAADLISERRIRLLTEARITADAVSPEQDEAVGRVLEGFARRFGGRILFIDGAERVRADSLQFSSPEVSLVNTQMDLDEIRYALGGDAQASVYQLSSGEYVLYAAAPVVRAGEIRGTVLISSSLAPVMDTLSLLVRRLVLTGVGIVVVFLAVTWYIALRLTSPLEDLTRAARRLGSGDLDSRVQVRSRDEVGDLAQTFNRMADQVQEHDLAQRQFISDASHELRSPVSSALLLVDAIDAQVKGPQHLLGRLREQLERMGRLVNQLLELARLAEWEAAAQEDGEPEYADVSHVVNRVYRRMEPVAESEKVQMRRDITGNPVATGEEENLERIVQNLVENAIKYTPSGGTVKISAGHDSKGQVVLRIADDGVGIPSDALPHIFDRFYRADPSRSREQGGFGLGLAIVRRRVEAMGGNVEVNSKPDQGTSFTIKLRSLSHP